MIEAWRPWLPEAALDGDGATDALLESVEAWLTHWFMPGTLNVRAMSGEYAGVPGDRHWAMAEGMTVAHAEGIETLIGAAALRMPRFQPGQPADSALLERLGDECLQDLRARLARQWGFDGSNWRLHATAMPPGQSGAATITVGAAGQPATFTVRVTEALRIARRKRSLAPWFGQVAPSPRDAALVRQHVAIGARIGLAALTLEELSELVIGDVIVLDTSIDAPLPLTIEGHAAAGARVQIGHDAAGMTLRMLEEQEQS